MSIQIKKISGGRIIIGLAFAVLFAVPVAGVEAEGGSRTNAVVDGLKYWVHTFTSNDWLSVTTGGEIEYFVVGGGGGGGNLGGGGGGGIVQGKIKANKGFANIVIGNGGIGHGKSGKKNATSRGGDSSIEGGCLPEKITAAGGGSGGYNNRERPASAGGSGGGGGSQAPTGGAGTGGQGNKGGNGAGQAGGGGGGAGGPSEDAEKGTAAAAGGIGRKSSFGGAEVVYAAGGAGCRHNSDTESKNGAAGTGNGGDGGWKSGGNGGSGIVLIRYLSKIQNMPVSGLTANGATLNGFVADDSASSSDVFVLWGPENGSAGGSWANTNLWKAGALGANTKPGLDVKVEPDKTYFYTFGIADSKTRILADPPMSFFTGEVQVNVTKRESTEAEPASFLVYRPETSAKYALTVHFTVGGTGIGDKDYDAIRSPMVIPAGKSEIEIPVVPIFNLGDTTPKTIELSIAPGNYIIGSRKKSSMLTRVQ